MSERRIPTDNTILHLLDQTLPNLTVGDLTTVSGALLNAAAEFVDWEVLYRGGENPISTPGKVLLFLHDYLKTNG